MSSTSSFTYETVYILRSGVSESDASTIHQKVDNVISKFSGKLINRDDWGNKELAYEIDGETNGKYSVIHYNGKGGVVEEIERHFKILDDVVRFMTVKVDKTYDYSKFKKQLLASEEEMKRNKEAREQRKRGM
jgi:small subunit ribosomal protein S6